MNLPHALDGLLALLQVGRGGDGVRAEKHRVGSSPQGQAAYVAAALPQAYRKHSVNRRKRPHLPRDVAGSTAARPGSSLE
jgi:hypothetical protein